MVPPASLLTLLAAASAVVTAATERKDEERVADEWFPQVGDNLTRVDWAHAVNDRGLLAAALASEVMFIEADIVLGHVSGAEQAGPPLPVMAHPPALVSDLSLEAFLAAVAAHNARQPLGRRKGIKLDFKSIEAFEHSQALVEPFTGEQLRRSNRATIVDIAMPHDENLVKSEKDKMINYINLAHEMAYPVWLNADILPGPVAAVAEPVDASRFLQLSRSHTRATLSIGWTTLWDAAAAASATAGYTSEHTGAMLAMLRAQAVAQPVTYPVRAGPAAATRGARDALLALLRDTADLRATLTVWASAGDPVDVPALRELVLAAGLHRVYLDVPAELADMLRLPSDPAHSY